MFDELVKALRFCTEKGECNKCGFYQDGACRNTLMKQAADAIEDLQKQRDEWESHAALAEAFAQGWIPVTERLPEKYNRVLVYSKATRMGRSIDFINSVRNWYTTPKVTHWMPLPEPPDHIGDITDMVEPPKDGEA